MAAARLYGPLIPIGAWLGLRAAGPSRFAAIETAVGTVLVVAAIAIMSMSGGRARYEAWLVPAAVDAAFVLFGLVASGDLAVTQAPVDRRIGVYANGWNLLSPALTGVINHRFFFYLPLLGLITLFGIGTLLAITVSLVRSKNRTPGAAAFGMAGLLPAAAAAPAACGPSLLAALGAGAASTLGALATPLLALSALVLAVEIWWLIHK